MLRTIRLHGRLKEQFGEEYKLETNTLAETVRALCITVPRFRNELSKGQYKIRVNTSYQTLNDLDISFGIYKNISIEPVIAGADSGGGGVAKIVLGVALVAASFFIPPAGLLGYGVLTGAIVGGLGAGLALSGINNLISDTPKVTETEIIERPENRPSFLFNGAVNVAEQGLAIPICAGRRIRRAGSVVLSAGIKKEQPLITVVEEDSSGNTEQVFEDTTEYNYVVRKEKESDEDDYLKYNLRYTRSRSNAYSAENSPGYKGRNIHGNSPIYGHGSGGGGSEEQRQPVEEEDNLKTTVSGTLLDLISEGEIGGLVSGLKSIYYNNIPIANEDNTTNFEGIQVTQRFGTSNQDYVPGFDEVEREKSVGQLVTTESPVEYAVTDELLDAVRVTLRFPRLFFQNDRGDIRTTGVSFNIQLSSQGLPYRTVINGSVNGKTTTGYERSYRIQLTGEPPWVVRVVRTTPDADSIKYTNEFFFARITEIIEVKLSYPNCALIGQVLNPKPFNSSFPRRAFDVYGVYIKIPSNYDPETREYTGLWDGTFKLGITDNPAWWFYALSTNKRWGMGKFSSESEVDKWTIYSIGQFSDVMVDDGQGGLEPRYRFNLQINNRQQAYKVLQSIASCFRGMTYIGAGYVTAVADIPEDPIAIVGPANVVDGMFTYTGTSLSTEFSVVHVAYNDPTDNMKVAWVSVEDQEYMQKLGYKATEYVAYGCESRSQAIRTGRHILESQREGEVVSYVAGLDHASLLPGQIVKIMDPWYSGADFSGRIIDSTFNTVTLDRRVDQELGKTYTILFVYKNAVIQDVLCTFDASDNSLNLSGVDLSMTTLSVGSVIQVTQASNIINNSLYRIVTLTDNKIQVSGTIMNETSSITIESVNLIEKDVTAIIPVEEQGTSVVSLASTLSVQPAPGSMWMLSSSTLNPRTFRIVSIRTLAEEDTKFEVSAVFHDPNKLARIEDNPVVEEYIYSQVPTEILARPQNLSVGVYSALVGNAVKTNALLSWGSDSDPRIVRYQVQVQGPDDPNYIHVDYTASLSMVILDISTGIHKFRVRGFDALGNESLWSFHESYLSSSAIEGVQGFRASLISSQVFLEWDQVESTTLSHYVIRFTAELDNPNWNNSQILLARIPKDSVTAVVPAYVGSYLIKSVDVEGVFSTQASIVSITNPGITDFNLVIQAVEHPNWLGTKEDTTKIVDVLELASSAVMADWVTLAEVDSLRGFGNVTDGYYYIENILDLGEIFTSRLSANIKVNGINRSNVMSTWQTLASVGSLAGADSSEWNVDVEYRQTDDDPSSSPVWSEWKKFSIGDYTARAYDARLRLTNTRQEITPSIKEFTFTVDMPDRIESGDDILCPLTGVTITFSPKFREKPAMSIIGQGMVTGDVIEWSATASSLSVKFYDSSGGDISRTFDYIARGYGYAN